MEQQSLYSNFSGVKKMKNNLTALDTEYVSIFAHVHHKP